MPLVVRMETKLSTEDVKNIAAHCEKEGIEDVYQVLDNKGGYYFQGKDRTGTRITFRI